MPPRIHSEIATMTFTCQGNPYRDDAQILVRVYENQQRGCEEKEQCAGEILFRPKLGRDHIRFTSWLPRGLVEAIKTHFADIRGDFLVQISNELPDCIGVLTSCRANFEVRLRNEFLKGRDVRRFDDHE
jgi:hypothetical protein